DGAALLEQIARRGDMRGEPVEFLTNVGLRGKKRRLLRESIGGKRRRRFQKFLDQAPQSRPERGWLRCDAIRSTIAQPLHLVELRAQDFEQPRALLCPGSGEIVDEALEIRHHELFTTGERFLIVLLLDGLQDASKRQQAIEPCRLDILSAGVLSRQLEQGFEQLSVDGEAAAR